MLNRVLIIDDSKEFRNLLKRIILKEWSQAEVEEYEPRTDYSAGSDIDLNNYDLVFLDFDLGLADEDGLTWLRKFTNIPNAPSIIMISGKGTRETELQAIKLGAAAYINKSGFNMQQCIEVIKDSLEFANMLRDMSDDSNDKTLMLPKEQIAELSSFKAANNTVNEPTSVPQNSRPAEILDYMGYKNITHIAQGGAAEVLLAHDTSNDEKVIIKVIRTNNDDEPRMLKRFVQEYTLISQLHHPHVIQIHERSFASGYAYIVMEYFPGGDLTARIKSGVTTEQSLEYLRQMAEGLKAVHELGIVHRDIKSANILFRENGTLAITDFGIAKSLSSFAELTMPGEILGSPHYMSPEQIDKDILDYRSDIYSLGVLLFEMLTGRKPFKAKSLIRIFEAHLREPIPSLPAELAIYQPLIDRMMAKNPDDRFANAAELLKFLDGFADKAIAVNA